MKIKKFETYDKMLHNKKVDAFNIILSPEERDQLLAAVKFIPKGTSTAERISKYLKSYYPYKPEGEDKQFPNGAFNAFLYPDTLTTLIYDYFTLLYETLKKSGPSIPGK